MGSDWEKDLQRQLQKATERLEQEIPVPTDCTEDEAVQAVISRLTGQQWLGRLNSDATERPWHTGCNTA